MCGSKRWERLRFRFRVEVFGFGSSFRVQGLGVELKVVVCGFGVDEVAY
jgi:hypothetical protein